MAEVLIVSRAIRWTGQVASLYRATNEFPLFLLASRGIRHKFLSSMQGSIGPEK